MRNKMNFFDFSKWLQWNKEWKIQRGLNTFRTHCMFASGPVMAPPGLLLPLCFPLCPLGSDSWMCVCSCVCVCVCVCVSVCPWPLPNLWLSSGRRLQSSIIFLHQPRLPTCQCPFPGPLFSSPACLLSSRPSDHLTTASIFISRLSYQ